MNTVTYTVTKGGEVYQVPGEWSADDCRKHWHEKVMGGAPRAVVPAVLAGDLSVTGGKKRQKRR